MEGQSPGSPCDCPAYLHDRESPLVISQVEITSPFNHLPKLRNFRSGMLFWYPDQLNIQRKQFKLYKIRDIIQN